jgi:hypothetical protein
MVLKINVLFIKHWGKGPVRKSKGAWIMGTFFQKYDKIIMQIG